MPAWLASVFACLLNGIAKTYRLHITDPGHVLDTEPHVPRIVYLWHNRLLFLPALGGRRFMKHSCVLISASRDGEYISNIVRFFGLTPVRGSSSRGGAKALFQLCESLDRGMSAILTVDGPRGPRYTVHPGIVAIARKSQVEVVPVTLNAKHKWCLKSWDRMQIPVPFSRVELVLGRPFSFADGSDVEQCCQTAQDALMALTED